MHGNRIIPFSDLIFNLSHRDELRRVLADLLCRVALGVVDGVALRVKAQNLVGYRRRPAGLNFVQMSARK